MYEWDISDAGSNCWILLVQAYQASRRATEIELARYGLTIEQFHILMLLKASRVPLSPGEIAAFVFREKHSISERLTRMHKTGYVRKIRSVEDKRVVKIEITPKGKEFLSEVFCSGVAYARSMIASCLSDEDIRRLDVSLRKIRDHALRALGEDLLPLPPIFGRAGV